jgi:LDH2 family malate/lactate/ureidoglycolate dehydrogenase
LSEEPISEPAPSVPQDAAFSAAVLIDITARVLAGMGAPSDSADLVARSLVLSNLVGHDSHGLIRLLEYSGWVRAGQLVPDARPTVAWSKGGTALVDGHWGWGQTAAALATGCVIESARASGTATVVLTRSHHVGRLGEWVDMMASEGMMGIAFCNTGGAVVAPFGGVKRVLGTNPYAWSTPGPDGFNLVLDFSTAVIAAGKVVLAGMSGQEIPAGALLDRAGLPSTRAADLDEGGALLAFGGHKGSGLSVLIEMAAGLLSGTLPAAVSESGYGNGTVFIAVDVARYVGLDDFKAIARQFAGIMHDASPLGSPAVLLPGELEARTAAARRSAGVAVAAGVRRKVVELAAEFGVDVPEFR